MIVNSEVVPTEYDVWRFGPLNSYALMDDHRRKFTGPTLTCAFRKAEAAQDPADPIHHV